MLLQPTIVEADHCRKLTLSCLSFGGGEMVRLQLGLRPAGLPVTGKLGFVWGLITSNLMVLGLKPLLVGELTTASSL